MARAVGDARLLGLAALQRGDGFLDPRQILRVDAGERGRSDQLVGPPAHDADRRRRGVVDLLIQPDAGHHVARPFRQHAEIGLLGGKRDRHPLSLQQLPHQIESHHRNEQRPGRAQRSCG